MGLCTTRLPTLFVSVRVCERARERAAVNLSVRCETAALQHYQGQLICVFALLDGAEASKMGSKFISTSM